LNGFHGEKVEVFSLDVKDLYYSISKDAIRESLINSIWRYGIAKFRYETGGLDDKTMVELVEMYLRSTVCLVEGEWVVRQKSGICIGSRVAPVLSDLVLAEIDNKIRETFEQAIVSQKLVVFRYVDDYLIIIRD